MEFLKQVYNSNENNDDIYINKNYQIVDVYNRKKFNSINYLSFLTNLDINKKNHLAEIPLYPSPILVDIDIKENINQEKNYNNKLYNNNMIQEIILEYIKYINIKIINTVKSYKILLLEKPIVIKNDIVKNGFHLHFISISLNKEDLKNLFDNVKEISKYKSYLDDVYNKPWLLYGNTKIPEDNPYLISTGFEVKEINNEFIITEEKNWINFFLGEEYYNIKIDNDNIYNMLPAIMSIRNINGFSLQIPNQFKQDPSIEFINTYKKSHINNKIIFCNISKEKISNLVMSLNEERSEEYNKWLEIAMILAELSKSRPSDINYFYSLFHSFSKQSDKYDEIHCDQKWNSLIKSHCNNPLGLGSLLYFAKEDGIIMDEKDVLFDFRENKIPTNDYDIAYMIKFSIIDLYKTHKEFGCYKMDGTIWKEIIGWENLFKKHVNEWSSYYIPKIKLKIYQNKEENKEMELEKILKVLIKKVKNYSSLNNIVKSLFDLYFDENLDKLFDQKENLIAFNNFIFDIEKWELIEPSHEYYIRNRIEHDYIDWDKVPEDNRLIVKDFWCKIFPNKNLRRYCINNFARIITGRNSFKQFQFWTGDGDNGKSACISLLEYIFGRMCMKVPKTIVTGVIQKQGGTNPELYRLKDARMAIIDEVTNNDILDPGQIKGLTGNDKLFGRDLYQKSKDIKEILPLFFPILITNDTPIIKKPDDATWGRIRLIRFESVFTSNPEEYYKKFPQVDKNLIHKINSKLSDILKKNAKYFLSYFMKYIFKYENFEEFNKEETIPEKVTEGLEKFKQGQNILKQFLEENYIVDSLCSDIITTNKIMKEYNGSRPKVTLAIEDIRASIITFSKFNEGVTIINDRIKGLMKVEY